MDFVLATEVPEHPVCQQLKREFGVTLLPLKDEEAGFLDSRAAALRQLAAEGRWTYVLPVQEDFLLEGRPMGEMLESACFALAGPDVASVRLMPCPGPAQGSEKAAWWEVREGADTYGFTFQATLWRLDACVSWYRTLCAELERQWPRESTDPARRIEIEVRANFAENMEGQQLFWKWSREGTWRHMGWVRTGRESNAVYRCPWPYRPTAIVKGRLEPWARELAAREGFAADVAGFA